MIASIVPAIQSVDAESYKKKTFRHVNSACLKFTRSGNVLFNNVNMNIFPEVSFLKNNLKFIINTLISKTQEEIDSLTIFWISICFSHSSFTGSLFMLSSHNCLAMDSFQPFLHVGICQSTRYKYIVECFLR